ncbi:MAG: hypothetical protein ACJ76D_01535 [Solirubrobacterales bacterium]
MAENKQSRSKSRNGSSSEPQGDRATGALHAVGEAAGRATVPLVAGGAAIAGAAGGLALATAKQGRRKGIKAAMPRAPKVTSGNVAKAAKEVGNFSAQVGALATELQRARESANGADAKRRSPIEVVLQGLTARR